MAEDFGKRHAEVLRGIDYVLGNDSTQNCVQYFITSEYRDSSGKRNKEYLCTRDGFTLLAMGFKKTLHQLTQREILL
ncbi:Rha family transcriptional regulator [Eubacterium barkeri]|uniref:Rha family transcriptional regulator n=1 Tax=Eubacterium barkeri TaxID=1528 RepID=UPI001FA6C0DE|nr:Rha family transcriptional regulator [Eubacterium barkeri]